MFSEEFSPTGRGTLAGELFEFLRHAILQGDLAPGTRMVEQVIADETDVSRTPVRDALRQLETTGFVQNDGRGLVVIALSSHELRDMWVVMESLQGLAAKLAAVHRSEMDLLELSNLVEAGQSATQADDVPRLVEINRRFHAALQRASENHYLSDIIQPMVLRIETMQDFTTARRRIQAQKEHEKILQAIQAQDSSGAESAMFTHLQNQLAHAVTQETLITSPQSPKTRSRRSAARSS